MKMTRTLVALLALGAFTMGFAEPPKAGKCCDKAKACAAECKEKKCKGDCSKDCTKECAKACEKACDKAKKTK